ncbi:hypothetical protein LTS15_010943 [Exophiala xenobiotica]|nr:hypothetical protein LTS15_010943 [Exophiala xenobiotica]
MIHQIAFILLLASVSLSQTPSNASLAETFSQYPKLSRFASILSQYGDAWNQANSGGLTILAPTNDAISNYLSQTSTASNDTSPAFAEALVTYHLLEHTYSSLDLRSETQFIPTLLTNQSYVNDILFFSPNNSHGFLHSIDNVLKTPTNFDATVTESRLTGVAQILAMYPPPAQLNTLLVSKPDWTLFAPNRNRIPNTDFSEQDIYELEAYHFLQGPVKYSTSLKNNTRLRTLEGKDVTITVLDNGTIYVNDVRIINPDFLMSKGVIHVIDTQINPNDTSARPELTSSSSTTPEVSSSGLSTGAKAGIGVGAALGALIFTLLAFFLIRNRKGTSQRKSGEIAELDSREKKDVTGVKELHGRERPVELSDSGQEHRTSLVRTELDSSERSQVHELG